MVSFDDLRVAFTSGNFVTGVIVEKKEKGFQVEFDGGIRAFLPWSRSGLKSGEDGDALVGSETEFKIERCEKKDRFVNVVLSVADIDSFRTKNLTVSVTEPASSAEEEPQGFYIHPVKAWGKLSDDEKRLEKSIEELVRLVPRLDQLDMNKDAGKSELLIRKVFSIEFPKSFYIRNLSFDGKKNGKEFKIVGLRCMRISGDWMDTGLEIPVEKNLLFIGKVIGGGKELSVTEISLIADEPGKLDFEAEVSAVAFDSLEKVKNPFMLQILENVPSLVRHTEEKLQEWEEFLNWERLYTEQQSKGYRYIEIQPDEENRQLVFVLAAGNESSSEDIIRIVRREGVRVYEKSCSRESWNFVYDSTGNQGRRLNRSIELGEYNGIIEQFTLAEVNEKLRAFLPDMENKLIDVYGDNLCFLRIAYKLTDKQKNVAEAIAEYPKEGFLAFVDIGGYALIKRFQNAIQSLKNGNSYAPRLGEWLFDIHKARLPEEQPESIDRWLNSAIEKNPNQVEAIQKMLNAPDVFLLQGPPGTGKTTVIAEAIYQFVIRGRSVLVASQSNDAVDNALERLSKIPEIRVLRLDQKNREDSAVQDLDADAEKLSEDTALQFYYRSLANEIKKELSHWNECDKKANDYEKDELDLNFAERDIAQLQNDLKLMVNDHQQFSNEYDSLKKQLADANEKNERQIDESRNLDILKRRINNSTDVDFYLSDDQLRIIENDIQDLLASSSARGINLGAFDVSAGYEKRNASLWLILLNRVTLEGLASRLSGFTPSAFGDDDPHLQILEMKRKELKDRIDTAASDEEAEKLGKEIRALTIQIDRLKETGRSAFTISENEKYILSEELQQELKSNPRGVQGKVADCLKKISSSFDHVVSVLDKRASVSNGIETSKIVDRMKVLDGKKNENSERMQEIRNQISEKKETSHRLLKKYFGNDALLVSDDKILKKIHDDKKKNDNDLEQFSELRSDWGNSMQAFQNKLIRHSKDELADNDREYFGATYLKSCNVVGVSCTANPRILSDHGFDVFDVVIIDEVSKAMPPELLIPLMKGRKTVLVGDHRQLPPTFGENDSSYQQLVAEVQGSKSYTDEQKKLFCRESFEKFKNMVTASLFKEYFEKADDRIKATLYTQYRMHSNIMDVINRFYDNRLSCGILDNQEEIRAHGLTIQAVNGTGFVVPEKHAYWIDSSKLPDGRSFYESKIGMGKSSCNFLEETMTFELLKKIAHEYRQKGYGGLDKKAEDRKTVSVGVISFYLRSMRNLYRGVKILCEDEKFADDFSALKIDVSTVDRFQGQERNIIIATLVRNRRIAQKTQLVTNSNITSFERINVAFSRAQNLLFIIGARDLFKQVSVTLTDMNTGKERTISVYSGIMNLLQERGSFFESDCLISQNMVEEIQEKWNKNENENHRLYEFQRGRA